VRVRRDRIDKGGKVTLRRGARLHHIGAGHAHKGKRVILLVDGLDVRVLSRDGELLRHLTLDPRATTSLKGERSSTMLRHTRPRCADTSQSGR